jgi:tetratricopeptide (TPR) repeat protein
MARKKLNKKVALIGSLVFLLLVLAAVVVVLRLSRDPEKFVQDGDAAWLAKDYQTAERNYLKAYGIEKSNEVRIEILSKLADVYIQTDEWPKVRGCWEQTINIDPRNLRAQLGRLKFFYILADTSVRAAMSWAWEQVQSQASGLIKVVEDADLLMEDKTQWEPRFATEKEPEGAEVEPMGPYLYLARGRAAFELARMGAVTMPDESLAKAIGDLEKVLQLDPNNVDAYWYLAQATIEKGELLASRGNLEERDRAGKQADEVLQQAVKVADADQKSHINLLSRKLTLAQRSGAGSPKQQIQALEPEYLSLANKFPSSAEVSATVSGYYSVRSIYLPYEAGLASLDKAIEAVETAIRLDEKNAAYALRAANLYYRKFSVYGQESEIYKALVTAKNALKFPGAQDTVGPRHYANMGNKLALYCFLANCYIEQILEPCPGGAEFDTEVWLKDAEKAVREIELIYGTTEEPQIIKWQGMLELAKGNTNLAISKLYTAYEQIKVSKTVRQRDAQLSYTLGKIFKDTSELGAAVEFLASALQEGIEFTKPEAVLDYLEVLGKLDMWSHVISSVNPYSIDAFESNYGPNQRSRTLRIKALISTNQGSEAEEELAKLDPADADTIKLNLALIEAKIRQIRTAIARKETQEGVSLILEETKAEEEEDTGSAASLKLMTAELSNYTQRRAELVRKLLLKEPNSVSTSSITTVCRDYVAQGQTSEAKDLVDEFLGHFPDNAAVLFYKQLLSEPDPANVPEQRREEIEKQVLLSTADPIHRAVQLGLFYRRRNELDKAVEQFEKALAAGISQDGTNEGPAFIQTDQMDQRRLAAGYLFDIALEAKDWTRAEQLQETSRRENLDDCEGQLFATRLAVAKGEFEDALMKINDCLTQKPVFSRAYMLRSSIYAGLGNEHASLEDMRKAASLNPLDGVIAKGLANALYLRNHKLGASVSPQQVTEVRQHFEMAIRLNPGDVSLLGAYAEYIASTEPSKALAIVQAIQVNSPTLQNAILLARLATGMAQDEKDAQLRESLFKVADSALQWAKSIDPYDRVMLQTYADYYRASGQNDKAKQVIQEAKDQRLLWRHYYKLSEFDNAKKTLLQLYRSQPKDTDVLKGLLLVSDRTNDAEAAQRYSEELLSVEDNVENRFDQIKVFLKVGLVKEAEHKLQSFKEKYPGESAILVLEGWLAMRQGQLKKALELTTRNLETNQDNAVAWRLRGEINLLIGDYSRAIIDLRKSKSLSSVPATRISLAKAYLATNQVDDAITELENAIDAPASPLEARVLLERIHIELGRNDELKRFYDSTLKKLPQSMLWRNRAGAFALATGQFDRAEQLYKEAYLLKRDAYRQQNVQGDMEDLQYAVAFDGYLQALVLGAGTPNASDGQWRPEKLDKVFEEGRENVDTSFAPIAYFRMAQAKHILGARDTAIEYCRKAVDKAGTNEKLAGEILLRMFLLLGGEEVSKYCEQRLETNPDSLAANFTMFNLAKIKRQYDTAISYIDKCIELAGLDTRRGINFVVKKAEILMLMYEETSDNNYLKKAIADYESLLDKMPNNSSVLNNLAYMFADGNERLSTALKYAEKALEQKPNSPSFLDTYGYVLYKNGRYSEADEFLTASLQQYEQGDAVVPVEVYEHLGMIKEALGEKAKALDAYKKALDVRGRGLSEKKKERINKAIEALSR